MKNIKKHSKKLSAIILALSLTFSALSYPIMADDAGTEDLSEKVNVTWEDVWAGVATVDDLDSTEKARFDSEKADFVDDTPVSRAYDEEQDLNEIIYTNADAVYNNHYVRGDVKFNINCYVIYGNRQLRMD